MIIPPDRSFGKPGSEQMSRRLELQSTEISTTRAVPDEFHEFVCSVRDIFRCPDEMHVCTIGDALSAMYCSIGMLWFR